MADPLDPKWRWSGECWQHHHGLAGHINAKCFGEDPATVRVPREPTEAMLQVADDRSPPVGPLAKLTAAYCDEWRKQQRCNYREIYQAMLSAGEAER